jgi:membrane-bound lytic murein transglycosylase MltF
MLTLARSAILAVLLMQGSLSDAVRAAAHSFGRSADRAGAAGPTTKYDDYFRKFSKRYFGPGFAWRVFKAQAMAESGLDSTAKSAVGARGLMQIMPQTFDLIRAHRPDFKSVLDAQTNIAAGVAHDADLWKLFHDISPHREHYRFMMGAYNAGEGTIMRAQRVAQQAAQDAKTWNGVAAVAPTVPRWRYRETLGYVNQIAIYYRRLKSLDPVQEIELDLEGQ